jgi:hypothetical protein
VILPITYPAMLFAAPKLPFPEVSGQS